MRGQPRCTCQDDVSGSGFRVPHLRRSGHPPPIPSPSGLAHVWRSALVALTNYQLAPFHHSELTALLPQPAFAIPGWGTSLSNKINVEE
jgi:hypothetical protein